MSFDANEDISFDYDENAAIDDEGDSILSGESGKNERRRRDINLYQLLTKKRRFINFLFRKITMISFLLTVIYNIFWIIKMKTIDSANPFDNFYNYRKNIIKKSYIFLIKGFFILFLPQLLCGSEKGINDFAFIWVILKSITSFFMSYSITSNMEKELNLDKNFKIIEKRDQLDYWINLYHFSECLYIKGIYSFLLIILSAVFIKILKESWRTLRYSLK